MPSVTVATAVPQTATLQAAEAQSIQPDRYPQREWALSGGKNRVRLIIVPLLAHSR